MIIKNGNIILKQEMKSFIKNFVLYLNSKISNKAVTIIDTSGNSREVNFGTFRHKFYTRYEWVNLEIQEQCDAPENDITYGILVGSGTAPVSPDDYTLSELIGSDKLSYGSCLTSQVTVENNVIKFTYARPIVNMSSDVVTINETGIVMKIKRFITSDNRVRYSEEFYMLIARDVLDTSISLNPNEGANVIYTIKVSV